MHNMLKRILEIKKQNIKQGKYNLFKKAILNAKDLAYIGEVKFASPSEGIINSPHNLLEIAKQYEKVKLDAISIITEKHFFKGNAAFIPAVKKQVKLPILQKDFIIDESQIFEAKALGSNALLLIARIVDTQTLKKFVILTKKLNIEPVVEVATTKDLQKALKTQAEIIAVNARDLDTFTVNTTKACKLMEEIPSTYIRLAFSGIKSSKEVKSYKLAGAKGVLIGTSLMKTKNIKSFIKGIYI